MNPNEEVFVGGVNFSHSGFPSCCGMGIIHGFSALVFDPKTNPATYQLKDLSKLAAISKYLTPKKDPWGYTTNRPLLAVTDTRIPVPLELAYASVMDQTIPGLMYIVSDNYMRTGKLFSAQNWLRWLEEHEFGTLMPAGEYNAGTKLIRATAVYFDPDTWTSSKKLAALKPYNEQIKELLNTIMETNKEWYDANRKKREESSNKPKNSSSGAFIPGCNCDACRRARAESEPATQGAG